MSIKNKVLIITILTIFISIMSILLQVELTPFVIQRDFLNNQDYKLIYTYDNENELDDSYYNAGKTFYLVNTNAKADILMMKDVEYSSVSVYKKHMGVKEIAMSINLMEYMGVKIGDKIILHNPLLDIDEEHKIVDSIDTVYGIIDKNIDKSKGVIICGYDEKVISNIKMSSVLFTKEPNISHLGIKLLGIQEKDNQIKCTDKEINKLITLEVLLNFFVVIIAVSCMSIGEKTRLIHKRISGASVIEILGYIFKNIILGVLILIIAAIIINILLAYIIFKNIYYQMFIGYILSPIILLISIISIYFITAIRS